MEAPSASLPNTGLAEAAHDMAHLGLLDEPHASIPPAAEAPPAQAAAAYQVAAAAPSALQPDQAADPDASGALEPAFQAGAEGPNDSLSAPAAAAAKGPGNEHAAIVMDNLGPDWKAPAAIASDLEVLPDEVAAEVLRQVEFYFSEANLPTDEFLLKQVRRSKEGWVPLPVIADFRKMRKLTRSLPAIAAALRPSSELEVNPEGSAVRRVVALPDVDLDEVRRRTVAVDNLAQDKPTIEQVEALFAPAGDVIMVRIRKPGQPEPLLTKALRSGPVLGAKTYALVEFKTAQEAAKAVQLLDEPNNWRGGLRVRLLLRPNGPPHKARGGAREGSTTGLSAAPAEAGAGVQAEQPGGGEEGGAGASSGGEPATKPAVEQGAAGGGGAAAAATRPQQPWMAQAKRRTKSEYATWASASAARQAKQGGGDAGDSTAAAVAGAEAGEGAPGGSCAEASRSVASGADAPGVPRQPTMPDGSRGFAGQGRGKPLG